MMFNAKELFKERFSSHVKETSRYLKYMFNGHIAIAMLFLISAIAVYYQQWLMQLPEDFPTAWVMSISFGLLVTIIPVRTLLKQPDLVFLLPAEQNMTPYFRYALGYSFVTYGFMLLFVFAAFSPLYMHTFSERSGFIYLLTICVIFIFLAWNLLANWWMLSHQDVRIRYIDLIARLLVNTVTFFLFIEGRMLLAAVSTILFMIIFLYDYSLSKKHQGLAWELLIEKDQQRLHMFYRMANMFTDVPHLKSKIKKRHWLVSLINRYPLNKKHTYDYLYRIAFIRSGDYLGMYVRLTMIGGLLIWFVPHEWMKLIFSFLFIYMTTFQLMTLYHHFRTQIWLDLYPIVEAVRKQSVKKWLFQLAYIQVAIFTVIMLMTQLYMGTIVTLCGGILFNYGLIQYFSKSKW